MAASITTTPPRLNSSPGNLLTYVWVYSCKLAESVFIADDHLLPHLTIPAGVPPLDISHQPLHECFRSNCGHRRRTVDELAATLHFSHRSCKSSNDFQFAVDMQRRVRFWRCCCTD